MSKYEYNQSGQPNEEYWRMVSESEKRGAFYAKDFIEEPKPTVSGAILEVGKIFEVGEMAKIVRQQVNEAVARAEIRIWNNNRNA